MLQEVLRCSYTVKNGVSIRHAKTDMIFFDTQTSENDTFACVIHTPACRFLDLYFYIFAKTRSIFQNTRMSVISTRMSVILTRSSVISTLMRVIFTLVRMIFTLMRMIFTRCVLNIFITI
jgi:hypothetical protein